MSDSEPTLSDVQGNILTAYGVGHATYLLYRVDLADEARQWLGALVSRITTEQRMRELGLQSMLNVAVTFQGLAALGLSPSSLASFPVEFQQGMKRRAALLCDFGDSAPEHWNSPLGARQVHVLVVVHGTDRAQCDDMVRWIDGQIPQSGNQPVGVTRLWTMPVDGLPGQKEHFGFKDNISQPWIEGTNPGPPVEPHGGKRTKDGFQPLKLGEFVLGHMDELNRMTPPLLPERMGRNGSYMVVRKLYQDVAGFRREMERQAAYVFGQPADAERLAAHMLGRWPSGCPVDLSPEKDNPDIAQDPKRVNAFAFDDDQNGLRCPIDAHIRRVNPRDSPHRNDDGQLVVEPMSTRHRMIRRGLPYGKPIQGSGGDTVDRGLLFTAFVADIGRQFEFVQHNWINDGDPFRLDRTDRDPIAGNNRDPRDRPAPGQPYAVTRRKFTVPSATRIPWALNLPEFVMTRGGEYFFLPSLTVVKGLAQLGFSSFLAEYERAEAVYADPGQRARAQAKLISDWLIYRPKEMLDELKRKATGPAGVIFQAPGYSNFGVTPIAIVTKYADVLEVLDSARHPQLTVKLYQEKMDIPPPRPPRGPFILGRETSDPLYKLEQPLLGQAVGKNFEKLPVMLGQILDPIMAGIRARPNGSFDLIQDVAWPVPLGLNDNYFGVPGPDDLEPNGQRSKRTYKGWLRDIYKELFLNLRRNPEWTKEADAAAKEMNPYLEGLIQQVESRPGDFPESVLRELIALSRTPGVEANFVRRNIMGLVVGVVETTLKAIARTTDQLLRRPQQLAEAQKAARDGDKSLVRKYVLEAMRFNPQNHVLFRLCVSDTIIADGTPRRTTIKAGTLVFASTLSAMFDEEGPFDRPAEFRLDRDHERYLFFGHDGHACLGRYLIPVVLEEVFVRLLTLPGLRRSNEDPFDPVDVLPQHLMLEFNAGR